MSVDDTRVTQESRPGLPLSDVIVGAAAVLGGIAVIAYALTMPTLGEGRPGPGLFPGVVGGLAALFGLLLMAIAVVKWRRGTLVAQEPDVPVASSPDEAVDPAEDADDSAVVVDLELAQSRTGAWVNALVVVGAIVFYVVAAPVLGFLVTMFAILLALMKTLGSRWVPALIIAVATTAALYALFELVLLVQLPDGFLV